LVRVAASIPASYILLRFIDVTEELVGAAGNANLRTFLWTLNSEKEFEEASKIGVDGIVTDDPHSARTFFGSLRNARDAEQA